MKLEYQIESKNFVLILNKIFIILILCIFGIFLFKILTFFSSQLYNTNGQSSKLIFVSLCSQPKLTKLTCGLCRSLCESVRVSTNQVVFLFLLFIAFLHIQRQPFEGGIVRQLSEQRFFVRYQNSEVFIYCLSFFLSFYFFFLKIQAFCIQFFI